jgi:uncharacterized membrane protein
MTPHYRRKIHIDAQRAIAGEIGIGFFKRLSRSVKSAARTVAKVAKPIAKVGKAIIRNPYIKAGVAGLALVFPVAAPLAAGMVAADKLISMAESADKVRADAAKAMIAATKTAAKTSKEASKAWAGLSLVYKKRKEVAGMTDAQRAERNRIVALKEREDRALLAAARAAQNAPKLNGYLVTPDGRIVRGKFLKG